MKVWKWLIPLLIVLGVAVFFIGKWWFKERAPEVFSIEQLRISIGQDTIFLDLSIKVPTSKPVKWIVDSMRYRMFFDTVQFSSGMKNFKTNVSDTLINLPLWVDRELLFSTIRKMQVKDSANLNIELEPFLGKKKLPFAISKKIRVPIPPEITVAALKIDDVNLHEVSLDATLQVVNLNDIEFVITDGVINLDFLEMFTGKVDMKEAVHIKARDTTMVDVDIELEEMKLAKTAWNMVVNQKNVVYDIRGKLFVTPIDNPRDTIDVILNSPGLKLKE